MNRRVVLVVIAVLLALTGTVVVYAYVKHADNRALADTKSAHVLVVEKEIPAGTPWSLVSAGSYAKRETIPLKSAPEDAISTLEAAIDSQEVATAVIKPGQLLLRQMFQEQALVTGALPIPKGKIAVTVSVSSSADVAGYVAPQSEVAVFGTYQLTGSAAKAAARAEGVGDKDKLFATRLLVTNIRVIATSSAAPTDVAPRKGSGNGGSTSNDILVTVAVTQQEAQKLILSQQVGQLYLGLLSDESITSVDDEGALSVGKLAPAPIFVK